MSTNLTIDVLKGSKCIGHSANGLIPNIFQTPTDVTFRILGLNTWDERWDAYWEWVRHNVCYDKEYFEDDGTRSFITADDELCEFKKEASEKISFWLNEGYDVTFGCI